LFEFFTCRRPNKERAVSCGYQAEVRHEHGVTPRELFFDLVFVFAFTRVTTLLADDPTFAGIGRGVLVLAALWWPWTAYAWPTNTVDPEEGFVGAALLVALVAMFLAAHAVPRPGV
jgi:low temperature requirement protein LtrA